MRGARLRPSATLVFTAALVIVGAYAAFPRPVASPRWESFGQLAEARWLATTVAIPGGPVFVFGGLDNDDPDPVRGTTELIDPSNGKARVLPQRLLGRVNHTATLARGKIVVVGGTERIGTEWAPLSRVDVYGTRLERWSLGAPLHTARSDHGTVALADGRLLVVGGTQGPRQLDSVEIYDPDRDVWTDGPGLPTPRSQFSIARLPDGRVLVAGGLVNGSPSRSTLYYDVALDRWMPGPDMLSARVLHATAQLDDGDLLLVGGQRDGGGSAERYDVRLGAFVFAGTLALPRMLAEAIALPSGGVLVVGGLPVDPYREKFTPTADAEMWDPKTNAWTDVSDPATPGALGGLVLTYSGVLRIGGAGDGEKALGSIQKFVWR